MRIIKSILGIATLCALFLPAVQISAQAQEEEVSYPVVNRIIPQFDGYRGVSDQFVFSNIQLRPGMNYNPVLVDQSIRALYNSGFFEFVEVRVENAADQTVDVFFDLVSKYTIERIRFNGNEAFTDKRLGREAEVAEDRELESGDPLDEYLVSVAADALAAYYVKKGYPDVVVDYRISRDERTGYATVDFDIEEGGDLRIDDISFVGNEVFKDKRLRKQLETKKHNWISWLTGSGKFDEKQFKEDLDALRQFYRNNGYLDSVVDEELIEFSFDKENEVDIIITVSEGQLYYLGEMTVENNTIFTNEELLAQVQIETGEEFSPEAVDEAATAIRDFYTSRGYLDSGVRAERVPNMENRRIDLVFRVRESERFYLESIRVEGNTKSKANVIIRE
jgi:outer membrane protein insertion porin family